MPRFFKENFNDAPYIEGEDAHHIIKSLRMKPGEPLTVCDTKGTDYYCVINECKDGFVGLDIVSVEPNQTEPDVKITLFQCLPKGDKMDSVVRQSVELGVYKISPTLSDNCVSRPDVNTLKKKVGRWQKIANEAAGQCGRGLLPVVEECLPLSNVAETLAEFDLCVFCYELGGKPIAELFNDHPKSVAVIIGPEGGFSAKEAALLVENSAVATTLGPRILRTETAPLAAIASIMLLTGNMK